MGSGRGRRSPRRPDPHADHGARGRGLVAPVVPAAALNDGVARLDQHLPPVELEEHLAGEHVHVIHGVADVHPGPVLAERVGKTWHRRLAVGVGVLPVSVDVAATRCLGQEGEEHEPGACGTGEPGLADRVGVLARADLGDPVPGAPEDAALEQRVSVGVALGVGVDDVLEVVRLAVGFQRGDDDASLLGVVVHSALPW